MSSSMWSILVLICRLRCIREKQYFLQNSSKPILKSWHWQRIVLKNVMVITIGDLHMKNGKEINGIIMRGLLQCLANTSHEHYALKQNQIFRPGILHSNLCSIKGLKRPFINMIPSKAEFTCPLTIPEWNLNRWYIH